MRILAIETSCDESAVAIVELQKNKPKVIKNIVSSQIRDHQSFGGVIPNLASRLHTQNLPIVLEQGTEGGRIDYDAIAVTTGPGLIGSLLVGVATARTLAWLKNKPIFPINHLEGHIYSAWLNENQPELPSLILTVSGGHTELIYMSQHGKYLHIGRTRDDAAGEAFDKTARLLDLGYPGGPLVSELAKHGRRDAFTFPIGLPEKNSTEFSFSGIKAALYYQISKLEKPIQPHIKADIAASFEYTIAETLIKKLSIALSQHLKTRSVCFVGGVSANDYLRLRITDYIKNNHPAIPLYLAPKDYTTDNAAMIATAGCFHNLFGSPVSWYDIKADPNLELK